MKLRKYALHIMLVSVVLLSTIITGCAIETTGQTEQEVTARFTKDVTPMEASALIEENLNNPDFIIIDVRTPEEYAEGHVENAVNIDYRAEDFSGRIGELSKDKTYLIYCKSGFRSGNALNIMVGLDFMEIYHMPGGFDGWVAEGLPTVR